MASYTLSIFAATVLLASLIINPSSGVPHNTLATICSHTENQKACETLLESNPNTISANLPKLSLISIDLALKQAVENQKTFLEFRDNNTFPRYKNGFNDCVGLYKDVQINIQLADQLSREGHYKNIVTALVQAEKLAYKCAYEIPINILAIDALNKAMILASETAKSVHQYIVQSLG